MDANGYVFDTSCDEAEYHSYGDLATILEPYLERYDEKMTLRSIGTTEEGRHIPAIELRIDAIQETDIPPISQYVQIRSELTGLVKYLPAPLVAIARQLQQAAYARCLLKLERRFPCFEHLRQVSE